MARRSINPNRDAPEVEHTRATEWSSVSAEMEREDIREEARLGGAALDETLSQREADARREIPETITQNQNARKDRSLPGGDAERRMLSSRMQKDLNKSKRAWVDGLPETRKRSVNRTVGNRSSMEGLNSALNEAVGMRSELRPSIRRRVSELDRSIADFEANNEREHIVYSTLAAPHNSGSSRKALREALAEMSVRKDDEPGQKSLAFDGYIPATHSMGNLADGPDIVMEIRTRSGAYLGSSDTTPNADHIVGRGRLLRPRGVQEVTYVKPDGTRASRVVVQVDDVTPTTR